MKILIVNGPNLNFLGIREPEVYGMGTYIELIKDLKAECDRLDIECEIKQSNSEGQIIDYLQATYFDETDFVILNAGAYTHYSYAINDCIKSLKAKTIEVHLSDINNREDYRKHDVIKDNCVITFMGKGKQSYLDAINYCKKEGEVK